MKKGFTLIELLAVIVLLAVVALIAYPSVYDSVEKSRKESCKQTVKSVIEAASQYGINNDIGMPTQEENKTLTLNQLISSGYLPSNDYINPINSVPFPSEIYYYWDTNYNQYVYTYAEGACEL